MGRELMEHDAGMKERGEECCPYGARQAVWKFATVR